MGGAFWFNALACRCPMNLLISGTLEGGQMKRSREGTREEIGEAARGILLMVAAAFAIFGVFAAARAFG